jgi:hypothetical protein
MSMLSRFLIRVLFATLIGYAACAAHAQALRPLPPDFLATLQEIDAAVVNVAGTIRRFKSEDLGMKSPTAGQLDEALVRMDKGIDRVRSQVDELRRRESLLLLLSIKGTLGGFSSDLVSVVSLLQSATVRSPAALDRLNRELADLEKSARVVSVAFGRFDSGAQVLLERLDRQAGAQKP